MIVKGVLALLLWLALHLGWQSTSQAVRFGVVMWPSGVVPQNIVPKLEDNVTGVFSTLTAYAALKAGGEVVTWGDSDKGGDSSAVKAKLRGNVTTIFSNNWAFAALKSGGEVVTWGHSRMGGDSSAVKAKLRGNVSTIFSTRSGGRGQVKHIRSAAFAALKSGGEVVTWGDSSTGGDSSTVEAQLRGNVTTIFSNDWAFAALKADGEVVTWGHSSRGGDSSAVKAKLRGNVTTIFSNDWAFVALKAGGKVVTWGHSSRGGDSSAVKAKLRDNVSTIFHTGAAFAALKAGGKVVTWGDSSTGGDSSAVEEKLRREVTTIFSNGLAFAALKADGEVVTWGHSSKGGDSSAVEEKLRREVTTIFSNGLAFAALKAGGEVVTWGHSSSGGDSSAVKAKLRGNVSTIFSTGAAFAALKAGGKVVTWGYYQAGGDSSSVEARLSGNVTNIFSLGSGDHWYFAALKAGWEVVIWGGKRMFFENSLTGRVTTIIEFPLAFGALICIPRRSFGGNPVSNCELCSDDEVWSGLTSQCQKCELETEVPNADQSKCEPCKAGFIPDPNKTKCTECLHYEFAEAMRSECQTCPIGKVPNDDKSGCKLCAAAQFAEDGICKACPNLFHPDDAQFACTPDFWAFAVRIQYVIFMSIFVGLVFMIFSTKFKVIDVSLNHEKTILTTLTDHNLSCPFFRPTFPIQLQGTCHPGLDASDTGKPKVGRAKVTSRSSLELLDFKGNSINERFDTSRGLLLLTYADSFLHSSVGYIPLAFPAGAMFLATLILAINNLEAVEAGVLSSVAVLASSIFCSFMKICKSYKKTPLEKKLEKFQLWLATVNARPTSCPKGPGRAIRLDKLLQTHNFFRAFIQDRTAYYLHGNILMPLTAKYRLSYAELVGPDKVDFFVSHYWGTEFTHFCSSLQKHAQMVEMQQTGGSLTECEIARTATQVELECINLLIEPDVQRQHVAYWICFCSNNQYDLHTELGGDVGWQESSFYLALRSPFCQSMCMVVDEKALPLTRSWCIFEALQALKLTRKQLGFDLLMCTPSGVLNYGNSSIEAAVGIAKGVSTMDLQDADASSKDDKMMIDRLVLEELGSFEEMNTFVREEFHLILEKAQQTCSMEFQNLFTIVKTHKKTETLAPASASQLSSVAEEEQSESHTLHGRLVGKPEEMALGLDIDGKWNETCRLEMKQKEELEKKELDMKKQKEEFEKKELEMKDQVERLEMKLLQMGKLLM